jgi:hypothetical protein
MRRWRWIAFVAWAAAACSAPSAPSRAGSVDVLDFLLGDAMLWPRVGSHSQNQVVDYSRREVCWVKYANPRTFECWRWDDQYVYHEVDHGIDDNTGESYSIVDARWLPRQLDGEWRLDVSTRIVWFDPFCRVEPERSGPFHYHQRAWIEPRVDGGGDIGPRETLVLEYAPEDPAGGPTAVETFYFGRGAGWYEWQRGPARTVFNRVGGPSMFVARNVICPMGS